MQQAESVTFGGSGLDRADDLRGDDAAIAYAIAQGAAQVVLLWRGKPLVQGAGRDRLARLRVDHPLLAGQTPTLLGRQEDGTLLLAHELTGWVPEGVDAGGFDSFRDRSEQAHPDLPADTVFAELRQVMTRLDARDAELAATAKGLFGWHASHGFCARCGAGTRITQSGWQRRCEACGAAHFPRTDPVVIMLITHGNSVLLGRSPGWPEGMFSLLAGFMEPGETVEAAVRREVWEETRVAVGEVGYLASQPWAFPASLMLGCRGAALSREITIDPVEIEAARWVSREDVMAAMAGAMPDMLPARKGAIAQFLLTRWLADRLD